MKGKGIIVYIRSVVTGRIVWLCSAASRGASRVAYHRAKKSELRRMRSKRSIMQKRRDNIMQFLETLTGASDGQSLPQEASKAQRRIKAIADEAQTLDTGFYEHIMKSRRVPAKRCVCSQN